MNRKLHFGCGGNKLDGWENTDLPEVDISKPLPYPAGCASHIFAEHVIEHISYQDAFHFFGACLKVLKPGGFIRVSIPDLVKISDGLNNYHDGSTAYASAVRVGGHGDGSDRSCLISIMFNHGHKAIWSTDLLIAAMWAAGFERENLRKAQYQKSINAGMANLEGHGKVVGEEVARFETGIVEGMK